MNQIKQLAGQTAVYGMGTIIPRVINFGFLTPFYVRTFATGEYGAITELYAYVVILNVIITFGMETGFFRYSQDRSRFKTVFTSATIIVTTLAILLVGGVMIFESAIAEIIDYSDRPEYIRWFSWIIALDCVVAMPFAKLRRQNRARHFSILKLLNVVLTIIFVLFFLKVWPNWYQNNPDNWFNSLYDPNLGVGYVFLANLIVSLIIFILVLPEFRSLGGKVDKKVFVDLLKFSTPLVVVGIAGSINEVADKIMLKFLYEGESAAMDVVGIYGGAFKLAIIMTLFVQMFKYAFEPFLFAQKEEDGIKIYAQIMDVFVAIGMLIFLFFSFYIDILAPWFFSKGKQEYLEAIPILPIILMANLFLGIYYSLSVWYKITDLTKYAAIMALGGSAITIILNAILIPRYSYVGSAWAHLICYTAMMVASYIWGRKVKPIPYNLKEIFIFIGSGTVIFILVSSFKENIGGAYYFVVTAILLAYLLFVNYRLGLYKLLFGKD